MSRAQQAHRRLRNEIVQEPAAALARAGEHLEDALERRLPGPPRRTGSRPAP